MLRLCSFGRSLLWPVSGRGSVRRAIRLLCAARRRWPDGRLCLSTLWPFELVRLADVERDGAFCGWAVEWCGFRVWWLAPDGCWAAEVSLFDTFRRHTVTLLEW